MKKKFLLGALVLFCLLSTQTLSFAQEENYLEEGKEWTIKASAGSGAVWSYTELVDGEVERYGYLWKRVLVGGQDFLLYRQEGKKIWACYPYNNGQMDTVPFLMFDFGLGKGDTAHLYVDTVQHIDDAWIVEDVFDSVFEPEQAARRCQSVYLMKYPDRKDIWVEGLGSLEHGLSYTPSQNLRGPSELICVQKSTGEVVYHNKKYHSCYIDEPVSKTYTGTLVSIPNPAMEIPAMPGLVMGLECGDNQYILSKKGWFWDDYVEVAGIRYKMGDSVEIEGVMSTHIDLLNRTYFELEIDTIKKIEKTVEPTGNGFLLKIGDVHYDASSHNIVIESAVRFERLEVFDAQGRCVLRVQYPKQNVSVAELPHGLYVYRFSANGTIGSGKFVR